MFYTCESSLLNDCLHQRLACVKSRFIPAYALSLFRLIIQGEYINAQRFARLTILPCDNACFFKSNVPFSLLLYACTKIVAGTAELFRLLHNFHNKIVAPGLYELGPIREIGRTAGANYNRTDFSCYFLPSIIKNL